MQTITTTGIHCKVATQNETRRFFFDGQSFKELADLVCQLVGLSKDSVVIKYTDDEGDLVTISSDEELNFARSTAVGGLLRLTTSEKVNKPAQVKETACAVTDSCCPTERKGNPWREKWEKKAEDPQWINDRINRCERKRQWLTQRLSQIDVTNPDNSKAVSKLQGKIQFLSSRIDCLSAKAKNAPPSPNPQPAPVAPPVPEQPLPSKEEVLREMNTLQNALPAMRLALRQANLQAQLRRTELQAAQHQMKNGDTSITRERVAELKQALIQAKDAERDKKAELKTIATRLCATRKMMKAAKIAEKATRKCNKDNYKGQRCPKRRARKDPECSDDCSLETDVFDVSSEKSDNDVVVISVPSGTSTEQTTVLLN